MENLDLFFPLSASVLAAFSQNLRKAGLLILHNALVAAAVTTSTSLAVFVFVMGVSGYIRAVRPTRKSLPFYGAAALIAAASQILSFAALNKGDVSVIVTLTSTSPLFTVVLSGIFLKDQEKIDSMVVAGELGCRYRNHFEPLRHDRVLRLGGKESHADSNIQLRFGKRLLTCFLHKGPRSRRNGATMWHYCRSR